MMRQYELVERVQKYNPNTNEDLLNKAYVYAMQAHGNQKRASGDPYFSHPLEVAAILTDLHVDDTTIVAALLHDVVEDTEYTILDIEKNFGKKVADVVEGLTKLNKLELVSVEAKQAENLRKLLLAIVEDIRVLLVKLADRLHNMRTLEHMRPDKKQRIAQETLEIYAPLSGRMGMQDLKDELEDICFSVLFPEARNMILEKLDDIQEKNQGLIETIIQELTVKLADKKIESTIYGRRKRAYSIWRKMEDKSLSFEQLSDVYGFRVLVNTVEDCYRALGVIHTTWATVPDRFKDFISTPKPNDYRSLHTTIIGPKRQRAELQVRTYEMHEVAEYGIAAHVLYKDGITASDSVIAESNAYENLRKLVASFASGDAPEEFLEHTKLELFVDQVYCFTPKGRVIALPTGATLIDFAYAVHTSIGNQCVSAKVNGVLMPLSTKLRNGDEVEIVIAANHVPPVAWENLAVTGRARSAIRRANRLAIRAQYSAIGEQIIKRIFEKNDKSYSKDRIEAVLPKLGRDNVDDVFASVGRGEMSSRNILKAVYPDYVEIREETTAKSFAERQRSPLQLDETDSDEKKPVRGVRGMPYEFVEGIGALPGERIVGILTPQKGVVIYPIHAKGLAEFDQEPERWIDVRWDNDVVANMRFAAEITVSAINEPGALAQIALVIAEAQGNIEQVEITTRSGDIFVLVIKLEVFSLTHLNDILAQLRTKPLITEAKRKIG